MARKVAPGVRGDRVHDLGGELLLGEDVRVGGVLLPVEGAEGAAAGADVRVVDVPVDDVGDDAVRVQFPADTSAKILTSGLLGDQYIGLEPGGDDKNLAGGDQIKMTQSAVVLENLIGQFLYNKAAEGGDKK